MTKQDVLDHLRSSEHFDESFKQAWISRIEKEGLTANVLHELKVAVAEQIKQSYADLGVEIDPNDPEYKAAHQKMMDELQQIDDELEAGLTALEEEGAQIFKNTVNQMEEDQQQAVRDSM